MGMTRAIGREEREREREREEGGKKNASNQIPSRTADGQTVVRKHAVVTQTHVPLLTCLQHRHAKTQSQYKTQHKDLGRLL